jgi:hypothetical protein
MTQITTTVFSSKELEEIEAIAADIVWGADGIGAVINRNRRQTFYLLENNRLPARRIGGNWVASRKALLGFLVEPPPHSAEG